MDKGRIVEHEEMTLIARYAKASYCEDYTVWSDGAVYSSKGGKWRKLRPAIDASGYPCVVLSKAGKTKTFRTYILVARAFIGDPPEGQEVRHLNGDKLDSRLENLAYGTRSENMQDAKRHGTLRLPKNKIGNRKLSTEAINDIRNMAERVGVLAAKYGVDRHTITAVRKGKLWKPAQLKQLALMECNQ